MRLIVKLQMSGYLLEGCLTVLAFYIDIIVIDGFNISHSLD